MVDIHYVRPNHDPIHERLLNWSRYVRYSGGGAETTPMFKHYRSYRGWHPVVPAIPVFIQDAIRLEKEVSGLPEHHRDAIRWWYVYSECGVGFFKACRHMGVAPDTMCKLVHDGRSMLCNRVDDAQLPAILRPQFNSAPAVLSSLREAEPSTY